MQCSTVMGFEAQTLEGCSCNFQLKNPFLNIFWIDHSQEHYFETGTGSWYPFDHQILLITFEMSEAIFLTKKRSDFKNFYINVLMGFELRWDKKVTYKFFWPLARQEETIMCQKCMTNRTCFKSQNNPNSYQITSVSWDEKQVSICFKPSILSWQISSHLIAEFPEIVLIKNHNKFVRVVNLKSIFLFIN